MLHDHKYAVNKFKKKKNAVTKPGQGSLVIAVVSTNIVFYGGAFFVLMRMVQMPQITPNLDLL